MTTPTLADAKLFLRVDIDAEDTAIQAMLDAAAQSVADYLEADVLPDAAPVRAAILLRTCDLYENRGAQSDQPLSENATFWRLLAPYRPAVV